MAINQNALEQLARDALLNLHNITTHTCEIDGDTAHAESYVLAGLLNHDGVSVRFIDGRYVDRLENAVGNGGLRCGVARSKS